MKLAEVQQMMKQANAAGKDDVDLSSFMGFMTELESHQEQLDRIEKLMTEFGEIADKTENGRKVQEDENFEETLMKELGLEEMFEDNDSHQDVDMDDDVEDDNIHPIE